LCDEGLPLKRRVVDSRQNFKGGNVVSPFLRSLAKGLTRYGSLTASPFLKRINSE